jgi:hypothetical protein
MGIIDILTPKGSVRKTQDSLDRFILETETLVSRMQSSSPVATSFVKYDPERTVEGGLGGIAEPLGT